MAGIQSVHLENFGLLAKRTLVQIWAGIEALEQGSHIPESLGSHCNMTNKSRF